LQDIHGTNTSGDTLWTKTYGGIEADCGLSVQQTSDDGYIIAGWTRSFGEGEGDVYLIKTNTSGDTLWMKTYGGIEADCGLSVQQTSDGGYIVAGYTRSFGEEGTDVYLIKLGANGDTIWTKTYGGTNWDYGYSVQHTSDGGYIITGQTESFGAGWCDVYLIRLGANGDTLWTRTYGGIHYDAGSSVQQTSDGGYIVAGWTYSFGVGLGDVYLIKTAPDVGIEETESLQKVFFISQSEPNPFADKASIKYELPQSSNVHIVIYNLLGQEIKTLVNEKQVMGTHTVIWDGRDNAGEKVSNGIYFLKFHAGEYSSARKLIMLR